MQSIVPKQCSALTLKGQRCQKQAVPGESECWMHHLEHREPKKPPGGPPQSPSGAGRFGKVALQAFFEAVIKVGIQFAIEHIHKLRRAGRLRNNDLWFQRMNRDDITLEELGRWYVEIEPYEQQMVLDALNAQGMANEGESVGRG